MGRGDWRGFAKAKILPGDETRAGAGRGLGALVVAGAVSVGAFGAPLQFQARAVGRRVLGFVLTGTFDDLDRCKALTLLCVLATTPSSLAASAWSVAVGGRPAGRPTG